MKRAAVVVRALAALAALVALVGGIPIALARFVGNPLPTRLIGAGQAFDDLQHRGLADHTVIKLLAIVVWVLWCRFAAAIIVELVAVLRGRPSRESRMFGANQRIAAALITPLVAVFSSLGGPISHAMASTSGVHQPSHVPRTEIAATASPSTEGRLQVMREPRLTGTRTLADFRPSTSATASSGDTHDGPTWTVRRNDSFWAIAEEALGDGLRWREVVSANVGHEVAPGVVFGADTPAIHPGWQLRLPSTSRKAMLAVGATSVTVKPGDSLSAIAAEEYGDAHAWTAVWDANGGNSFDGEIFDDPDLIRPGWNLLVPDDAHTRTEHTVAGTAHATASAKIVEQRGAVGESAADLSLSSSADGPIIRLDNRAASVPAHRSGDAIVADLPVRRVATDTDASGRVVGADPATAPNGAPGDRPAVGRAATAFDVADDGEAAIPDAQNSGMSRLLGPGAALLLATGMVGLLDSRRRHRLRRTPCGARLPLPSRADAELETQLRSVSNAERLARIDLCVRRAADVLGPSGRQVLAVLVNTDGSVELTISGERADMPVPPPPLMQIRHDLRWMLPAAVPTEQIGVVARFAAFPAPALMHVGRSNGAEVFVDLEAIGVLAVDASVESADCVVRAAVAGLATSPFVENSNVVVAGVRAPSVRTTTTVDDLDAAIDIAAQSLGSTLGALRPGDTTFALRHRSSGEGWEPAVVCASSGAHSASPITDHELVAIATPPGRGLGMLVAGAVAGATWSLSEFADGWRLGPLGLPVEPVGLSAEHADALADLLRRADEPAEFDPEVDGAAVGRNELRAIDAMALDAAFVEQDWLLMVRVLGTVDVVDHAGQQAEFEKSKALELVTWLADHGGTPTRSAARAALWEETVRDATFANVVSEARRALGRLSPPPAGEEWIGRTLTEALPIHRLIVSDVALLEARLHAAQRTTLPWAAIDILRPGLELVRDVPFAGTGYLWPDAEGRASNLLLLITSAAAALAERYLTVHDPDGVFWATGRGLAVLPGHEELIALRMRAHAAAGDYAAVRAEWQQYERVLLADPWSDGEPSPKLAALRAELVKG